jgi:hypothetical protein
VRAQSVTQAPSAPHATPVRLCVLCAPVAVGVWAQCVPRVKKCAAQRELLARDAQRTTRSRTPPPSGTIEPAPAERQAHQVARERSKRHTALHYTTCLVHHLLRQRRTEVSRSRFRARLCAKARSALAVPYPRRSPTAARDASVGRRVAVCARTDAAGHAAGRPRAYARVARARVHRRVRRICSRRTRAQSTLRPQQPPRTCGVAHALGPRNRTLPRCLSSHSPCLSRLRRL